MGTIETATAVVGGGVFRSLLFFYIGLHVFFSVEQSAHSVWCVFYRWLDDGNCSYVWFGVCGGGGVTLLLS